MSLTSSFQPGALPPRFRMEPFGESAIIVLLGNSIDEANYRQLAALSRAIQEKPPLGFTELVPAYNSLLVVFDPLKSDTDTISAAVRALAATLPPIAAAAAKDIIELPVAYGGSHGPDLESVAAQAGLSADEVMAIHSSRPYLVYMLGFTPGFPYLGGMDQRIAAPRLRTPRTKVPAGSVGIADTQTGVYPLESPGGWNLIGRTPLALFDPDRQDPALLAPGKYVHFMPISHENFDALNGKANYQTKDELTRNEVTKGDRHRDDLPKNGREPCAGSVKATETNGNATAARNLVILKPGALSTVQDSGRYGFQAAGVPPSGPMDGYSMSLANILAGNEPGAACIECTLGGLELRFESATIFALAGADAPVFLDDQTAGMHRTLHARAGAVLRLGMASRGLRIYLAAGGGITVPKVMGSRATFQRGGFGGLNGRALAAGDILPLGLYSGLPGLPLGLPLGQALIPQFPPELTVRAIPSHEADSFTEAGLALFFSASYSVSQKSDRMGCRLEGPVIEHSAGADIISSGVQTGTVQVPGDGQPIVLMADRQTTGGYTRIAQVIRADLPLLGQARPGDRVRFMRSTPAEAAKALALQVEHLLQVASAGLKATATSAELQRQVCQDGSGLPVTSAAPAMSAGAQSGGVRYFQVGINGQSFTVTVEELP